MGGHEELLAVVPNHERVGAGLGPEAGGEDKMLNAGIGQGPERMGRIGRGQVGDKDVGGRKVAAQVREVPRQLGG